MNSKRSPLQISKRNQPRSRMAITIVFLLGATNIGCGRPTETTRDNRRLLEAILTAVTIRSKDELTKDKQLLETRHTEGKLSDETQEVLAEIIEIAENGDWASAERDLYDFRTRVPFPK